MEPCIYKYYYGKVKISFSSTNKSFEKYQVRLLDGSLLFGMDIFKDCIELNNRLRGLIGKADSVEINLAVFAEIKAKPGDYKGHPIVWRDVTIFNENYCVIKA